MCKEAKMLKIAAANAAFFQKTQVLLQEINLVKLNCVIKRKVFEGIRKKF